MQREPLREFHLYARDLRQDFAFGRTRNRFSICLPPPASGGPVLEHGVEVIHPDKPEILGMPIDDRTENAAGSANRAIGDHQLPSAYGVTNLMVVANKLEREGTRVPVNVDSD